MSSFTAHNPANGFLLHAATAPERAALRIEGAEVSYGELAVRAGRIAALLLDLNDRADARVGILAQRSLDAYAGLLGACMAGVAYVPIGVDLPLERQLTMIRRARVDTLVTDRPISARLSAQIGVPIVGPAEIAGRGARPLEEARPVSPDTAAYLMFTSGTTGTPKAVVVTMGNVAHFLRAARERCPLYPEDRVSQFYDLTFDLSVFDIFHGLSSGACLHVIPAAQRMAPAEFIRSEALTVWSSVPSVIGFLHRLKQLKIGAFPSLRFSMFCGEPLFLSHVEAWRKAAPNSLIDNHYGPTEATVSCLGEWVEDPLRVTPSREVIAIGTPFPGMLAAIVDANGAFLPPGQTGELVLSGPQVAAGYFDDPELTRQRFRPLDHPTFGRAVFYFTGDLAYEDTDAHFHHLGRIDHQVKILGRRVEIEEIEAHLRAVTGGEAAAVAWPVQDGAALGIVAFVAGGEWTSLAAQEALGQRLPSYMVPARILRRDSLPQTPNGKLNRASLFQELERMAHAPVE